jgi:hypothetical protein
MNGIKVYTQFQNLVATALPSTPVLVDWILIIIHYELDKNISIEDGHIIRYNHHIDQ